MRMEARVNAITSLTDWMERQYSSWNNNEKERKREIACEDFDLPYGRAHKLTK